MWICRMDVVFLAWTGMGGLGSCWAWGSGLVAIRGVGWQLGTDEAAWTGGLEWFGRPGISTVGGFLVAP